MEFHFAIPEPSDEDKEAMKEHADREMMAQQALAHEHVRFFDELTLEQMRFLNRIFHQASHAPARAFEIANTMEGYTAALLTHKFNQCPCGEDHEAEIHKLSQHVHASGEGEGEGDGQG